MSHRLFVSLIACAVLGLSAAPVFAFESPEAVAEAFLTAWSDQDSAALVECFEEEHREMVEMQVGMMLQLFTIESFELGEVTADEEAGTAMVVIDAIEYEFSIAAMFDAQIEMLRAMAAGAQGAARAQLEAQIEQLEASRDQQVEEMEAQIRESFDPDGRIWVNVYSVAGEEDEATTWWVDAEEPLGSETKANLFEEAGELTAGSSVEISFTIEEAGTFFLTTESDLDLQMSLFDADGNELASNDDGANGLNPEITIELEAGTYHVVITGYDEDVAGPFTFTVSNA